MKTKLAFVLLALLALFMPPATACPSSGRPSSFLGETSAPRQQATAGWTSAPDDRRLPKTTVTAPQSLPTGAPKTCTSHRGPRQDEAFEPVGWEVHTYFVAAREGAPAVWVHNASFAERVAKLRRLRPEGVGRAGSAASGLARKEVALGLDPYHKMVASATGAATYRDWAERGITRKSIAVGPEIPGVLRSTFGRAFNDATKKATMIHFDIEGVRDVHEAFQLGRAGFSRVGNLTNAEIHHIASNPGLLNKTLFYRRGIRIPNPFD